MFLEITKVQLKEVRAKILEHQGFKCAICNVELTENDSGNCHVDHQHLFKSETLGENGNGLIRGVLCRDCNALEGKIWNNIHRYGKVLGDTPTEGRKKFLENLVRYYDFNFQQVEKILHPNERHIERIGRREYGQLIKVFKSLPDSYKRDGSLRETPKFTGLWSPKLKELKEIKDSLTESELKKLKPYKPPKKVEKSVKKA